MVFLEKISWSGKVCISCIKWRAGRYGKSEKWQNIRAVNCCLKCVPYENYPAQQFLSPNKKTPMRAVKSKKKWPLTVHPSMRQGSFLFVLGFNHWVTSCSADWLGFRWQILNYFRGIHFFQITHIYIIYERTEFESLACGFFGPSLEIWSLGFYLYIGITSLYL